MSNDHHDGPSFAHVASLKVLLGTISALMALTFLTVAATWFDFGHGPNLFIAMFIATVKATLVALFFMHLIYDKKFHSVVLVGGVLFAVLFISFAVMDRGSYLPDVIWDVDNPPYNP